MSSDFIQCEENLEHCGFVCTPIEIPFILCGQRHISQSKED